MSTMQFVGHLVERPLASVVEQLTKINVNLLQEYKTGLAHSHSNANSVDPRYEKIIHEMHEYRKTYRHAYSLIFSPAKMKMGLEIISSLQTALHNELMHRSQLDLNDICDKLEHILDICFPVPLQEELHFLVDREELHMTQFALAAKACIQEKTLPIKSHVTLENTIKAENKEGKNYLTKTHLEWVINKVQQLVLWYSTQNYSIKTHQKDLQLLQNVMDEIMKDQHLEEEKKFFLLAKEIKSLWNQGLYKNKKNSDIKMIRFLNENPTKQAFYRDIAALLKLLTVICSQCQIRNTLRKREWLRLYYPIFLELNHPSNEIKVKFSEEKSYQLFISIKDTIKDLRYEDLALLDYLKKVIHDCNKLLIEKIYNSMDALQEIAREIKRIEIKLENEREKLNSHSNSVDNKNFIADLKNLSALVSL